MTAYISWLCINHNLLNLLEIFGFFLPTDFESYKILMDKSIILIAFLGYFPTSRFYEQFLKVFDTWNSTALWGVLLCYRVF